MSWLSGIFAILGTLLSLFGGSNTSRTVFGPRVTDFRATNSKYGIAIADGSGTIRQSGNLIWASSVVEKGIEETECTSSGGLFGFGGSKSCTTTIRYEYYQSFAIAFGRGPADAFLRIFADGQVFADYRINNLGPVHGLLVKNEAALGVKAGVAFYFGDATNVPDPTISKIEGALNTPAYEDIVYAVFSNIQLSPFGNRIPTITAEIVYASDALDYTIVEVGAATTEQVFIGQSYITTQDATTYTIVDIFNKAVLNTNNYLTTTGLALPYSDIKSHIYSSYKYTGTASNLIQYDLISGKELWAYDLGANTENILALDFDYAKNFVYGISDVGVYRLPLSPEYVTPVVRSIVGVKLLKANLTTHGTVGSDIVIDEDRTIWAIRHDTTSNKKTYLVKYTVASGYVGQVIGPLTHASYSNPVDASTVLDLGEFITVDNTNVYIGSASSNWLISVNKATNAVQNLLSTAITTFDRTNFRSAKFQKSLYLESGARIDLSTLTVAETIDLDNAFTNLVYGPVTHAYFIPVTASYLLFDATSIYFAYLRYSATGDTLQHILEKLVTKAQLEDLPSIVLADLDFSDLVSIIVDGYTIDAQKDLVTMIEPLAKVFIFDIVEQDGKLVAIIRGTEVSAATVLEGELTANDTDNPIVNITRLLDAELPREVSVTYPQASLDYQQATQRARKQTSKAVDIQDVAVDIVLTSSKARQAAEIILKDAWQGKEQYAFTLPRKYAFLSPTDLITFITTANDILFIRLNSVTYGENMSLECTGSSYKAGIYSSNAVGIDSEYEALQLINAYPVTLDTFEIPYVFRGTQNSGVIYYAIYSQATDTYTLYSASNTGAYSPVETYSGTPVAGTLLSASNNGVNTDRLYGPETTAEMDYVNSIIVQLHTSAQFDTNNARDEVYANGDNYLLIGEEVVFFKNITSLGNGRYSITGFSRNRLGYPPAAYESHVSAGERVLLLNTNVHPITISPTSSSLLLYAASNSNQLNTTRNQFIIPSNVGLKCLPPTAISASKSTNDLIITWQRRDRIDDNWVTHGALVNSETQEKYGIDVYNADGTLIRTKTVSDASTITYLGTEQTTDFGSVQTDYYIKINQYNSADEKGFDSILNFQANKIYFNDMSAETIGNQLTNSTKVWTTTGVTYNIIAGKYLELNSTTAGNKALKLTDKLVVRNAELLIKFRIPTTGGFSTIFRGKDDTSGLAFTIASTLDSAKFTYFATGTEGAAIVSETINIDANIWYFLKVKNIESLLLAKVWKAHLYEPENWDLTGYWEQDRECGWIGLGQQVNGSKTEVSQIKVTVL